MIDTIVAIWVWKIIGEKQIYPWYIPDAEIGLKVTSQHFSSKLVFMARFVRYQCKLYEVHQASTIYGIAQDTS